MANHSAPSSSDSLYDVFLSFSDGVGSTFGGHLYEALLNVGINTFRDGFKKQGTSSSSWDEIRDIIEGSRISMVVFCEDYPFSTRCLDELSKIVECYDTEKKRIHPVFYKVAPADVRWQKNSFGEAMSEHERVFEADSEKVKSWRSALHRVGDLSGEHITDNEYQAEVIQKIAEDIYSRLPPRPLEIKHVIGFNSRFEKVKSIIDLNSNDKVRMVGIYGPSGIGKTTFALKMYNKIRGQFHAASFIGDISKKSRVLEDLQTTILSDMNEKIAQTTRGNTDDGGREIKSKLNNKRVLLVLDDVDNVKQLEALAAADNWFGSGSRIIITSKKRNLLNEHEVKIEKYRMEELNGHESLELFCWHAFDMSKPAEGFEEISARAVSFAKGVPSALEAIGCNLKELSIEECEMELDKYEKVPNAFPFLLDSF